VAARPRTVLRYPQVSVEQSTKDIIQTAHGLSLYDVVRLNSSDVWEKALATDENAIGHGIVVAIPNANSFQVGFGGLVEDAVGHGLGANGARYVSDVTPGLLTATAPTGQAQHVVEVVNANRLFILPAGFLATSAAALPAASQVGQVLHSADGLTFAAETPLTSCEGWLVNDEGALLVI